MAELWLALSLFFLKGSRVPRSFLVYWLPEQIHAAITDGLLDHAASEQFDRVAVGDVLWITGKGSTVPLITLGLLHVAAIVSQQEAEQRLSYPPWPATYHALCAPGAETATCEVALTPMLGDLEFVSRRSTRLDLAKPLGQQLQTMRQLSEASAAKLLAFWSGALSEALTYYDAIQRGLDSYESLDHTRVVLARREQAFLRHYLFRDSPSGTCAICGESFPVSLLVAAHIKPRAKCSDAERRDYAHNVVPMCVLGCDALFERGWVVVRDGKVRVRMPSQVNARLARCLRRLEGRPTIAWKEGRVSYFVWHAQHARSDARPAVEREEKGDGEQ
jgi:hypothetical protein